ncbi:unnamed protein product [Brachionus calyciflorus]|uniref:Uncharacterized protein n=1 Tax=Brachionus calyciflorus TaxID=104777 RepID=A0A814BAY1_9BILA|nr:unnamed protein product [Brachionus calyciflorus]
MVKLFGRQPAFQTNAVAELYIRKQLPGEDYRGFYTNFWNLAKYAYVYTGEFDQSKYDYLVKERFVTGLNEPSVFWRVDAAKPHTCAEAYDLVSNRAEFYPQTSKSISSNKQTTYSGELKTSSLLLQEGACDSRLLCEKESNEEYVSNRVINRVMFDESIVETCVGGPVNVIGKGRLNVKIKNFEEEIDVIVVDQLINDCLLDLDVAIKVADVKKCLDGIRQALTEKQMPKMPINNFVVDLNPDGDPERENNKTTEQHGSHDSDDVEAYKLIIQNEFSNIVGTDMSTISQTTICGHVIEMTTDKAITQTPREINFASRDEVKLQINDRTALNFETVTQPIEYESLKSESSVTIVQNHCIKSHLKAQSDTVQREYFQGGEEGIRARPHKKPPYILFLFVFRKFHIKLVASFYVE